jgi:hypothetical protein
MNPMLGKKTDPVKFESLEDFLSQEQARLVRRIANEAGEDWVNGKTIKKKKKDGKKTSKNSG